MPARWLVKYLSQSPSYICNQGDDHGLCPDERLRKNLKKSKAAQPIDRADGLDVAGAFSPPSSLSGGIWSAGGVGDFANELFEDVFECNQAACLAVLVDQASEV
jgi:hypothetical protein